MIVNWIHLLRSGHGQRSVINMKTSIVTNTILKIATKSDTFLHPLKLQKLLFFSCAMGLVRHKKWLINGDFYTWRIGPIEHEVYYNYPGDNITELMPGNTYIRSSEESYRVISDVMGQYGKMNAYELTAETHLPGSPWAQVYVKGEGKIDKQLIYDYYKEHERID